MKAEDFLNSIEQIDDNFITEAAPQTYGLKPVRNNFHTMKIVISAVACAAAVAGVTLLAGHVLKVRDTQNSLTNSGSASGDNQNPFWNIQPSDAEQVFDLSDYAGDGDPVENFKLEEFPELEFVCTQTAVTEIGKNYEHYVGFGMPITSVYTVDLNEDGYREIVYGWAIGSGLVHEGVNVYDIKNNKFYTVAMTSPNNCRLELRGNKLYFNVYTLGSNDVKDSAQLTMSALSSGTGGAYTFTGNYNDLTMNALDKPYITDDVAFFYDRILGRYDAVVYGHFIDRPCQPTDPNAPADENTERVGMQNKFFVDEFFGGVCDVVESDVLTVYGPCFVSDGGENLSYKFESGMLFAPFTEDSYWVLYLKRTGDEWNGEADAVNFLPISGLSEQFSVLEVPDVLDEIRESVPDRYANVATVFNDEGKCVDDWIEFQANVSDRYYYVTFPEGGMNVMDIDDNVYKTLDVDEICAIYLYDFDGDGKREMVCAEPPEGDTYKICVYSETQDFTCEIDKNAELCVRGDYLCVHHVDKVESYTPLEYYLETENVSPATINPAYVLFDASADGTVHKDGVPFTLNEFPDNSFLLTADGVAKNGKNDYTVPLEGIPTMLMLEDLNADGYRDIIVQSAEEIKIIDFQNNYMYTLAISSDMKLDLNDYHAMIKTESGFKELMDNVWLIKDLVVSAGMNPENYDCVLKPNLDPGIFADNVTSMDFDMFGFYQLYYGYNITAAAGSNIYAPASGTVELFKCDSPSRDENYLIMILGDDGRHYSVWFDHAVKSYAEGDRITAGTHLGEVPQSGEFSVTCLSTYPFKSYPE